MVADSINSACHTAEDYQAARCQVAPQAFCHLRTVKGGASCSYDAETGHVQDLRIAAQVEEHRWIINLQQRLRIFRLRPVYKTAAGNVADACQFLFRAFEGLFVMDGLRHTRGQAAGLQLRERGLENAIRRANLAQQARSKPASQPGSQRQREPGEGSV